MAVPPGATQRRPRPRGRVRRVRLPRAGAGPLASQNRCAGENGRASRRLRLDEQLAPDQLQAFLHAGQAETQASIRHIDVEADTFVTNGEVDGVPRSAKVHVETTDPAVSHSVVQGFLQDAE